MAFPKLNLPTIKLRVQRLEGSDDVAVWDRLRRVFLRLTGEEWVRQHVLELLMTTHGVAPQLIKCEYPLLINGQSQRADIVVLSPRGEASLLVECKAADIAIGEDVMMQATRYNSELKACNILLTNGVEHHLFTLRDGRYLPLELSELNI